jgi:hypothetical protein
MPNAAPLNGCALWGHGRRATYFVRALRISSFCTILDISMKISVGRSPDVLDRESHCSAWAALQTSAAVSTTAKTILVRILRVSADERYVSKTENKKGSTTTRSGGDRPQGDPEGLSPMMLTDQLPVLLSFAVTYSNEFKRAIDSAILRCSSANPAFRNAIELVSGDCMPENLSRSAS